MYNLDDHNLDRLSREAAELYETPGKPSWEQLQQQLDKELPLKEDRRRRGFFFFFIVVALLAGGGAWRYLHTRQQQEAPATTAHETPGTRAGDDAGSAPAPRATLKELHEKPGKQHRLSATVIPHSHETTTHKDIRPAASLHKAQSRMLHQPAKPVADAEQIVKNKRDITRLGHQGIVAAPGKTGSRVGKRKNNISDNPTRYTRPDDGDQALINDRSEGNNPVTAKPAPAGDTDTTAATLATIPRPLQGDPKMGKLATDSTGKAADKKQGAAKARGFSVALTAGADFSTVKFTYGDKTGYTAGITGAWHFSPRWSVHTGALYTRKNYKLKGSDYSPPEHYWTQYVDLQSVEGYCRMWEVPVQARYSFPSTSSRKFFLSAGVSSYFMRKESYSYYYKYNNASYERPWTNKTHLNHWFSILDLSAGIERKLNKQFSLEAEPYARIPLGGVGFGNIRLSSLGVNFSLRYRQPAKH